MIQLNDAKFFSLVGAKKGYCHVPLYEASSYLTIFSTPFGLIIFQDAFKKQLDSALEELRSQPKSVKPDNSKVAAIQNMQPQEDIKRLQSFLGQVNYLTMYSARLATITATLCEFTKKEVAYVWGPEYDRAFTAVKQEVSTLGVLRYFNPKVDKVIQTDRLQGGQPVLCI